MKLRILQNCLVKGGKHAEAGSVYDTGEDDKTTDREAFALISSGRALQAEDPDAVAFLKQFDQQQAAAKAAKAAK